MQNAPAQALTNGVGAGNHGVIYATHRNSIPIGARPHPPAAGPRVCVKKTIQHIDKKRTANGGSFYGHAPYDFATG